MHDKRNQYESIQERTPASIRMNHLQGIFPSSGISLRGIESRKTFYLHFTYFLTHLQMPIFQGLLKDT